MKDLIVAAMRTSAGSLIFLALVTTHVRGQTFTTLASFNGSTGYWPSALMLNGNTLYGTANAGGAYADSLDVNGYGTVFSVPINGGTPTVLASFSSSNCYSPVGGLTLAGNTLYGTTNEVGHDGGTIFSVPLSGGSPTVLASFNGSNGYSPVGGLTLADNTLYGTTNNGGTTYIGPNNPGAGTVFSVPLSGGSPTVLASLNGITGYAPRGGLTLADNTLYGTTSEGGPNAHDQVFGTVFSVPINGGTPTVLASLNRSGGDYPVGGLTLIGNTLYGMATQGGAYGCGTVYSVPIGGGTPTVLASFNGTNGQYPFGGLTLSGSTLYGTTIYGGLGFSGSGQLRGNGVVFSVPVSGGTPTVLFSFDGSNGQYPSGGLTLISNTLYGTTQYGGAYGSGQVFSLNIAPATISLSNVSSPIIISGGTTTCGMTVTNSPSCGYSLNYNSTAVVSSGTASLGLITPTSGNLAPGESRSCTVSATSTHLGVNTISLTASDPNSSNLTQTTTATLTVLDHSNASMSSGSFQPTQAIHFGNVLRGATVPSQNFTIYNRAANTAAAYTANLKLTGFTPSSNAAFQTSLATFNGLTAITGSNGNAYSASLNTSNYTNGGGTISMSASQLVDDSGLPGAGNNNNGGLTITLDANVGNATANASNSQTAFGTPLTAPVAKNASYANLESTATATSGSGGYSLIGSTATILAGMNSSSGTAQTVGMAWRTQTLTERTVPALLSDVVDLSGMGLSGTAQTDPFVLQMTYNPALLPGGAGNEGLWASNEAIYLGWLNPNTHTWQNAIDGNYGTNSNQFYLGAWPTGDMTLGKWGVNTANHTVWAVVDHNSEFAVVPEPGTLVLLAASGIGLLAAWRRRKKPAASGQDDAPAILSFLSRQTHRVEVKRRAA